MLNSERTFVNRVVERRRFIAEALDITVRKGIVIAAGMSGKIKTVLQMIAVPLLILRSYHPVLQTLATVFLWASMVMTVYSGIEYIVQNKQVFKE